jgi:secreted trypsin-like serine protease
MRMRWWIGIAVFLSVMLVGFCSPTRVHAAPLSVINGADVPVGEQPWVVAILQADVRDDYLAQFCGGTLIAERWVLTAAHCTFDEYENPLEASDLHVLVGRRSLQSHEGARLAVEKIIRHPSFDKISYSHDIALLHLVDATTIEPVHFVDAQMVETMGQVRQAMVVGWGVTKDGIGANTLQRAQVPVVPMATCQAFYADYGIILDATMFCAGYEQGEIDACTGDSGGPLVIWNGRQQEWIQIGIISWGSGCAEAGIYGVYTQVVSFVDWIEATIGETEDVS